MLFGVFPVLLALKQGKRKFHELILKNTFEFTLREDIKKIVKIAEEKSVPVTYVKVDELDALVRKNPHQVGLEGCNVV